MRIAVSGKGGVGKTALVATLCRVLGRQGRIVLACDFDVNPGLAISLGAVDGDGRLPREAVTASEAGEYGYALRDDLTANEIVARYAAIGPDGIRLVSLGTIDGSTHDLAATHLATRQVAHSFDEPNSDTVIDLEAGTGAVYDGGYVGFVDLLLVATDGSPAGNLTCRRLVALARALGRPPTAMVTTQATPETVDAVERLAAELDVALVGRVPADDAAVRRADVAGEAIVDAAPDCAAVTAVTQLADSLRVTSEGVRA